MPDHYGRGFQANEPTIPAGLYRWGSDLSAPAENLASRTVTAAGAGVAVSAGDANGFSSAVVAFLIDADRRARAGRNGRAYAERTFEIRAIADRFEGILLGAAGHAVPSRPG